MGGVEVDYTNVLYSGGEGFSYTMLEDGYVIAFDTSTSTSSTYDLSINGTNVGIKRLAGTPAAIFMFCGFAKKGDIISKATGHSSTIIIYGLK